MKSGRRHLQALEHLARRVGHLPALEHAQRAWHPGGPGDLAPGEEVVGRPQVVEEREILVDGLDAELARVRRGVDRHLLAVHADHTAVEAVDAVQALDQRRLAGAVVAEQRHHLASEDVEVDVFERRDRAEALARTAHAQHRAAAHACLAACATRTRCSMWPRSTSASTATRTITPIAINW